MNTTTVNWNSYAQVYDLMASNNPSYQELLSDFEKAISRWRLASNTTILDIGCGTGNFSILLAKKFPNVNIYSIDIEDNMINHARAKAEELNLENIKFLQQDVSNLNFPLDYISAIVSIHSLYAIPNPLATIRKFYDWLKPGGYLLACDFGRVMNVADWGYYLFKEMSKKHGYVKTLKTFYDGKQVSQSNKEVSNLQKSGKYWTHSPDEFEKTFQNNGFRVLLNKTCYRGYSDFLIGKK